MSVASLTNMVSSQPALNSTGASSIVQDWLLHFGRVGNIDIPLLLQHISQFGTVLGQEILTLPDKTDKTALRVRLRTSFSKVVDLKAQTKTEHPTLKLKIIPNGDTLQCKLFVKMNVYHAKKTLFNYFSSFGEVRKIELKYNHRTSKTRYFCFVIFQNSSSAKIALQTPDHCINGHWLKCFECKPYEVPSVELSTPNLEPSGPPEFYYDLTNPQCQLIPFKNSSTSPVKVQKQKNRNLIERSCEKANNNIPNHKPLGDNLALNTPSSNYFNRQQKQNPPAGFLTKKIISEIKNNHHSSYNVRFNIGVSRPIDSC